MKLGMLVSNFFFLSFSWDLSHREEKQGGKTTAAGNKEGKKGVFLVSHLRMDPENGLGGFPRLSPLFPWRERDPPFVAKGREERHHVFQSCLISLSLSLPPFLFFPDENVPVSPPPAPSAISPSLLSPPEPPRWSIRFPLLLMLILNSPP